MATAYQQRIIIPEQFCICGLCGAAYNDPKQLKCLHSFCRTCLVQYARNIKRKKGPLECPTCQMQFEESDESYTYLADDTFIKLLIHLSSVPAGSGVLEPDPNDDDLLKFDLMRVESKEKLRDLREKSNSLCQKIIERNRTLVNMKERLTEQIKAYYSDLTFTILEHLKEQEMHMLRDVDSLVGDQKVRNTVKMSWCRSVLENMDNKDQLLGNIDSEAFRLYPSVVMECLLMELNKQLDKCKTTLEGLQVNFSESIEFVPNNDERDKVVRSKFGSLSGDASDEVFDISSDLSCEHLVPNSLLVPRNRNSQSSIICYGDHIGATDTQRADDEGGGSVGDDGADHHENGDDVETEGLTEVLPACQIIISPAEHSNAAPPRDGQRTHSDEIPEVTAQDSDPDNISRDTAPLTTPDERISHQNMDEETIPQNLHSENNVQQSGSQSTPNHIRPIENTSEVERLASLQSDMTIADDEAQLPTYWDAVGDNVVMHRFDVENRGESSESTSRDREPRNRLSSSTVFTNTPLKRAQHKRSVRVQLNDDKRVGPVVAIAWLHNLILVVDRWNSKVKLFNEDGTFIHSLFFADGDPWDAVTTHLISPANSVALCAVTVPKQKIIVQIAVSGLGMQITNRLITPSGYCCISYDRSNSVFVCGVSHPFGYPHVDVLTMEGNILTRFMTDGLGTQLFSHVRSLDVLENGTIVVCDWKKNCIFFLRPDGSVVARYSGTEEYPLIEATGTTTDGRGYLLVSDSKAHKIHIVDKNGRFYGLMTSSCPLTKVKEINIRPYGPPMLALAHGKYYLELFDIQ